MASRVLRCAGRSRDKTPSIGRTRIVEVIDKGPGKGALLLTERTIADKATGELIGTVTQTIFCRGDGGFGGPPREAPAPHPLPARAPDAVCDFGTRPEMALIYRLSGDYNPLHADPAFAKAAGFDRPILHGLGTFGVSGHALLKTMCGYDPARLISFSCRFSAPVFPGETIRTEMWRDGDVVSFRARVVERDVIAINNGRAEVQAVTEAADLAPIREAVRALCADFPGEYWRRLDRERAYPEEFVTALTKAGFLAALIPEEFGGSGLTMTRRRRHHGGNPAVGLQRRRVPRADVHDGNAAAARQRRAEAALSAGDRARRAAPAGLRRDRADVGHRYAQLAHHGDARRRSLRRQRPEDLDLARRAFRSDAAAGAHHAAGRGEIATAGLSVFLVDMRAAKGNGLTIRPIRTMMNHATTEVFFENMRVPADNLIGVEGEGFRYILSGMNAERILIAAECIGDAKWFIDKAASYARERVVFGRPIGQNQGVQFPIARAYIGMRAAELMVREAAALYEAGKDCGAEANMAKHLAAEASWAAADMCVQTHGGFGFAEEFDIERKFRETRLYKVAPISTNLILSYIAEHVLGLPRSY